MSCGSNPTGRHAGHARRLGMKHGGADADHARARKGWRSGSPNAVKQRNAAWPLCLRWARRARCCQVTMWRLNVQRPARKVRGMVMEVVNRFVIVVWDGQKAIGIAGGVRVEADDLSLAIDPVEHRRAGRDASAR